MTFPLLPLYSSAALPAILESPLAVLGSVLVTVVPATAGAVAAFVSEYFGLVDFNAKVDESVSVDSAIALLDAGVDLLFLDSESLAAALVAAGVPPARIVLTTDDGKTSGVMVHYAGSTAALSKAALDLAQTVLPDGGNRTLYVAFDSIPSLETVSEIVRLPAVPVMSSTWLSTSVEPTPGTVPVAGVLVSSLTSDRADGLFTTLVVNTHDSALGLVYSSAESLAHAIATQSGVYQSRKRGLWFKGATSGAVQALKRISVDCDGDCLRFVVSQTGPGFCHNNTASCFGVANGLAGLERTLKSRLETAPEGSYTRRLFTDEKLLAAKILEEAEELTTAKTKKDVAWEAADLAYFALAKVVQSGLSLSDVEIQLDQKARKISRRKGDAKPKFTAMVDKQVEEPTKPAPAPAPAAAAAKNGGSERIALTRVNIENATEAELREVLKRPAQRNANINNLVTPIVEAVRQRGDAALLELTAKFDKAKLSSPVLKAPFPPELMKLDQATIDAIDMSFENVRRFHAGQLEEKPLVVETRPGVVCSRFARPIESVGLYVPGGTAILPSTAMMLGVPAMVAGCKNIIFASPPLPDGTLTPEVVYVAHKVGAQAIVLAGGAQAVAAMAYGTESVPKVNKILGPGNQFVTAAKMLVQNDTSALISIDMPAGPSEVLVIADKTSNPAFVASDLLSQAEHGVDSQVILIGVDLSSEELQAIEDEVHQQAMRLPRVDIVRGAIKSSRTFEVKTIEDAVALSNKYAPEHLIMQVADAAKYVDLVQHAGSVFVGPWSPESCGDYSSGTNHTLPTYGYATVYSGVNTGSFMKHLTSQELTPEGLKIIGPAVVQLADVEGLDAHGNAVRVRLDYLKKTATAS
ncbi:histidinol dehydrogenase-domain-containing protein [Limtongia smithiae]|uniref:histidinol dehydrogenase-domain-containing protein n=1 Tax=Limtongia smithiae TaxID=1125753 RepID=UPI0034CF41C9